MLWHIYMGVRMLQGLLCIVFNTTTVICVAKYNYLRSPPNILITGLAASDLLHGFAVLVLLPIRYWFTEWPLFRYLCHSLIFAEALCIFVQYAVIVSIAIERYQSLRAQLGYGRKWTMKKAVIVVASCWIFCFAYVTLMSITSPKPKETTDCTVVLIFAAIFLYISLILFFLTTFFTLIFYSMISCIFWKSRNRVAIFNMSYAQQQTHKAEVRITKMLTLIVGVFFSLYLPLFVASFLISGNSSTYLAIFYYICVLCFDINFWINPVIYAWREKNFKKAFKHFFLTICCKRNSESNAPNSPRPGGSGSQETNTNPVNAKAKVGDAPEQQTVNLSSQSTSRYEQTSTNNTNTSNESSSKSNVQKINWFKQTKEIADKIVDEPVSINSVDKHD